MEDGRERYDRACVAFQEAFEEVCDAVNAIDDPQLAERLAHNDLAVLLDRLRNARAVLRAQQVARIAESREMDLTTLGSLIGGVSKQRAGKILELAKTTPPGAAP